MKLDIGCGKNKKEGFTGVDKYAMDNVDIVLDVAEEESPCRIELKDGKFYKTSQVYKKWPWEDNSVDEIHCSHFLEHLTQDERAHFMNEAYRIMNPGAKATIITPHWASNRAYGDITHQWPAVSEMFFYYLKQEWRDTQAPHTDIKFNNLGLSCDFDATWGYSYGGELQTRNAEYVQFALQNYKEAAQDLYATLIKPLPKEE